MDNRYVYETQNIKKSLVFEDGKLTRCEYVNKLSGASLVRGGSEFKIAYSYNGKKHLLCAEDAAASTEGGAVVFAAEQGGLTWRIRLEHECDAVGGVIRKKLYVKTVGGDPFIDFIQLDETFTHGADFCWTIPIPKRRVYVPSRITTMGQPYYVGDMFFAGEFPMADNRIEDGVGYCKYHLGRMFSQIAPDGEYETVPFVAGAGTGARFDMMRASFFAYLRTIVRPSRFRVQFNSWYDHMLDIDSDKIEASFKSVAEGFKSVGYRPLDCYVVDDGWTDYKKKAFWTFDKQSFPQEFKRESALTEELGSTFGVWFGPRGGYTRQTVKYAAMLKQLGYGTCKNSRDICTGNPKYISDLCDRMAEFCIKYNVSYFKIDGFANTPCTSKKHGHPKGKGDGEYFYTFLWEEWIKGFQKIRRACPDVFLNITSYAHCSPYFLKWCDAVWLNNCGDMGYSGSGSTQDKCLNHRDGKYMDFFEVRQLQFPVAYLYNHEPCYAERNCYPMLPSRAAKTVVYDYDEFERYMYMCMMRGTGFAELYFSPSMFDEKRWAIAAHVLEWAESRFDVLQNSRFFGGDPNNGETYGYYAFNGEKAIMALRNPSNKAAEFELVNYELSFDRRDYTIREFFPEQGECAYGRADKSHKIELAPFGMRLFEIEYEKKPL